MDRIFNIYKEAGWTSFDVVAKMRGILKIKKIGHTGTLDPMATGVLPVCVGKATKRVEEVAGKDKEYKAVMLLGTVTDTQDMTGTVLSENPELKVLPEFAGAMQLSEFSGTKQLPEFAGTMPMPEDKQKREAAVRGAVNSFIGEYDQLTPMFSARKVNGKKLVDLARKGIEVERKTKHISIYDIKIEEINFPRITMLITCSKGTYIRTLCHDIGVKLGCGACMESLLRTRVGEFRLEDSITLAQLQELADSGAFNDEN